MMIKHVALTALLSSAALGLSGCGFTPLHADPSSKAGAAMSGMSIVISDVKSQGARDDRLEYLLRQSLKERLGAPSTSSPYRLELSPSLTRQGIGVRQDDVATRIDLVLDVDYVLRIDGEDKPSTSGTVRAISTYSAPNNPYAVNAALEDAEERVSRDAADRLIFEVARAIR